MPRPPAKCGTDGGYHRHHRITKTPPCGPCLDAHAAEKRRRLGGLPPPQRPRCECGRQIASDRYEKCYRCRPKPKPADDDRLPVAWKRHKGILVPVFEESEVA